MRIVSGRFIVSTSLIFAVVHSGTTNGVAVGVLVLILSPVSVASAAQKF